MPVREIRSGWPFDRKARRSDAGREAFGARRVAQGRDAAVQALLTVLVDDAQTDAHANVQYALSIFGSEAFAPIAALVRDGSDTIKQRAIDVLGRLDHPDTPIYALGPAFLPSSSPALRAAALKVLRGRGDLTASDAGLNSTSSPTITSPANGRCPPMRRARPRSGNGTPPPANSPRRNSPLNSRLPSRRCDLPAMLARCCRRALRCVDSISVRSSRRNNPRILAERPKPTRSPPS